MTKDEGGGGGQEIAGFALNRPKSRVCLNDPPPRAAAATVRVLMRVNAIGANLFYIIS
jgi:hypothetical protein